MNPPITSRPSPVDFDDLRERWRRDGDPDAVAFLANHPELADDVEAVRALAYEEYCLRQEAGEQVEPQAFCAKFPAWRSEIGRTLEVHAALAGELGPLEEEFLLEWPKAGDELSGYGLLRELGRGGFGRVFLARQRRAGNRLVVLKFSCDGAAEANTLGALDHPNIVPVYTSDEDCASGLHVVCMPYLGQVTVFDLIRKLFHGETRPQRARDLLAAAQVPEEFPVANPGKPAAVYADGSYGDAVLHLGAQLADGLAHAHEHQIAHRDVKPANLLVTPAGNLTILDFNLAGPAGEGENGLAGTLPYMAPEQLLAFQDETPGAQAPPAARAELYALGVILFELLTGKHPFGPLPATTDAATLRRHLLDRQRAGPPSVRLPRKEVHPAFARLIERCLAWRPADRPVSAAHVARLLYSRRTPRPRLSARLRVAAAGVLLTCGGFWVASAYLSTPPPPPAALDAKSFMQQGLDAYRQRDDTAAVRHFTAALAHEDVAARRAWALYLRGRAYQRQGEHRTALTDYQEGFALAPDWRLRACMGYCRAALGAHRLAIEDYTWVLDVHPDCAAVYSNRGYSYVACGDPESLNRAEKDFAEALRRAAGLTVVHANRARLEIQRLVHQRDREPTLTRVEVAQALAVGPDCAYFAFDLAWLSAAMARRETHTAEWTAWIDLGSVCAETALRRGLAVERLREENVFGQLMKSPRFHEAMQFAASQSQRPPVRRVHRLLDPVGSEEVPIAPLGRGSREVASGERRRTR